MLIGYAGNVLSYVFAHKLFKMEVPLRFQLVVSFITVAIGNLMDLGGVVGISLRAAMLHAKGAKLADSISASFIQTYFAFLTLLLLLPFSGLGLLMTHQLNDANQKVIVTSVLVGFIGSAGAASIVFWKKWRVTLFEFICKVIFKITKKEFTPNLLAVSNGLDRGIEGIIAHPIDFVYMMLTIFLQWFGTIMIVWCSFYALGISISIPLLITGFVIGMVVTNFAFVPGGFGVQEGSMAGTFALFGVDLHMALLVTLIFRVVYYFIPNFISLFLYWTGYRGYVVDEP
jgi:uncharacterized protein (TIRG00374 family)